MKLTTKLISLFSCILAFASIFPLGFATYTIIVRDRSGSDSIAVSADADARFLNGIEASPGDTFSYQTYHFLNEQGQTTSTGGVSFWVDVNPLLLDSVHRNDNGSGGYLFYLAGDLVCSSNVFARVSNAYTYFDSLSIGTTAITPTYKNDKEITFDVPFSLNSTTTPTRFKISCLFNTELIRDLGAGLSNATFSFSLAERGNQ